MSPREHARQYGYQKFLQRVAEERERSEALALLESCNWHLSPCELGLGGFRDRDHRQDAAFSWCDEAERYVR